ncbi:hypothetical protein BU26DRAFT_256834 [Trematosphaeria pertusa]|uniref:Uncharacterized protein n=1 Tax=Trematosphaeria pertusa TaxID=390896 RepID=A0A6A6IPN3_9PLEO|nr:uncharacterized protein BU26DRAFT_256834 [Trematosphaeria pertusa]KAF2252421.1 hypothetical protein BU26DRAFT_256834 [Trematosphaeria pertusa]
MRHANIEVETSTALSSKCFVLYVEHTGRSNGRKHAWLRRTYLRYAIHLFATGITTTCTIPLLPAFSPSSIRNTTAQPKGTTLFAV